MKTKFMFFILIMAISQISLLGQYRGTPRLSGVGMPYFEVKSINNVDSAGAYVSILIQILNDDLTFIKKDSVFQASTELQLNILDGNRIVESKTITSNFSEADFEETNNRNKKNTIVEKLYLLPGKYILDIQLKDNFTSQRIKRNLEISLPNLEQEKLIVSDILFYDSVKYVNNDIVPFAQPNIVQNFETNSPIIYANFNTYIVDTIGMVNVVYELIDDRGLIESKYNYNSEQKESNQSHWIRINRKALTGNRYKFVLIVSYDDKVITKNQFITFYWHNTPRTIKNLDEAIEQLLYIAPHDSIKNFKNKSFTERKKLFDNFWRTLDPDPETTVNELMDEYYRRVNYTIANFSSSVVPGWKTDRGRIYIKFGPPDEIVREAMPRGSQQYEVWRYYDLNKEFLFIDDGFGGFELHPNYVNVEYQ